jgi:hypothetical protein
MLLVLISVLIIIVVGAIAFYPIDRFVPTGGSQPAQNPGRFDLSCRNSAAVVTGAEFFGLARNKEAAPDRPRWARKGLSATGAFTFALP